MGGIMKNIFIILFSFLVIGCTYKKKENFSFMKLYYESELCQMDEHEKNYRAFYNSIVRYEWEIDNVKTFLEKGFDPNYCKGECYWYDSNPLLCVAKSHYTTFFRKIKREIIPDPTPDVVLLNLLVEFGANINYYPYVWIIVGDTISKQGKNESDEEFQSFISDENRKLKAFLDRGADVNAKANPENFIFNRENATLSYEDFCNQCKSDEATTPLYEAIKKGSKWESQVDLLLQYGAILDDSCIKAAELSGDEKMILKIQELMKSKSR